MRTILIIDDDPAFQTQTNEIFEAAGYRVLQALDGTHAIRTFEELRDTIDLAIVDLSLPGINGFELIGALSRRPSSLKIIATSGLYANTHLESAAALGAHAVLRKPPASKPIPRQQWLQAVQELIGQP